MLEGTLSDMLTQDNRTFVEMVAEMKPLLSTAYYCQQNQSESMELFMQEYTAESKTNRSLGSVWNKMSTF